MVAQPPPFDRSNTTDETPVPISDAFAESALVAPCRSAEAAGAVTAPDGSVLSTLTLTSGVENVLSALSVMVARSGKVPVSPVVSQLALYGEVVSPEVATITQSVPSKRSNTTESTPESGSDTSSARREFTVPVRMARLTGAASVPAGSTGS